MQEDPENVRSMLLKIMKDINEVVNVDFVAEATGQSSDEEGADAVDAVA